jgi:hypothetical protein
MNVDDTNPVNLTSSPNDDDHWSGWSPDRTKILFSSRKTGNVHNVHADGSKAVNVTGGGGGAEDNVAGLAPRHGVAIGALSCRRLKHDPE